MKIQLVRLYIEYIYSNMLSKRPADVFLVYFSLVEDGRVF